MTFLERQVRTNSVVVPGTSWNNNSEKWEHTGDRSLNNPYLEVECSACHTSNLTDSDPEETSHVVTVVQEKNPYSTPWDFFWKTKECALHKSATILQQKHPCNN